MNRKFGHQNDEEYKNSLENEIVAILKHLIAESDCLLNLHEGSGFYSPEYIDGNENPGKYGQSIIYDTATFKIPNTNKEIHLEKLATQIIDKVNPNIDVQRYHFRANNHDTLSDQTRHEEQRQSATYYALTRAKIPAFGVETSKTIEELATKIHLQKLVINTFMEQFDILIDTPGVMVDQPALNYVLVKVNDGPAFALSNGSTLDITAGDDILITDIIANYERGLVADILDYGSTNDTNIPFRISKPTKIVIRKDAIECGYVNLRLNALSGSEVDTIASVPVSKMKAEEIIVNVDGKLESIEANKTLKIKKGVRIILHGVKTNISQLDTDVFLNLKGFAPPKSTNDGNDLLFPIYTDQDLWVRYSENRHGKRYPIEATYKDKNIGNFWIELTNQ
jgi:hypothetical protein